MQQPKFTFDDAKFAGGPATFTRAQNLYLSGKIENIKENPFGYSAIVHGTHSYEVSISLKRVDDGYCTCYLGKNDRLCKHMLALALAVLFASGKAVESMAGPPAPADLDQVKKLVTTGMQKLSRYTGPSSTWFSYQRSLATGAGMIAHAVGALPPSKENAAFLWNIIERIDKKLANRVDDSDGVVGECAHKIIQQLAAYVKEQPELVTVIKRFTDKKTNFAFENDLQAMLK